MKAITAVILLSSVLYGEACIHLPHCPGRGCKPTTTTNSPTTPDYQDSTTEEEAYDANEIVIKLSERMEKTREGNLTEFSYVKHFILIQHVQTLKR